MPWEADTKPMWAETAHARTHGTGAFPTVRMRRNRRAPWSRRLVAENRLSVDDLIWSIFVVDGENKNEPIPSMPGVDRLSVDRLADEVGRAVDLGVGGVEDRGVAA